MKCQIFLLFLLIIASNGTLNFLYGRVNFKHLIILKAARMKCGFNGPKCIFLSSGSVDPASFSPFKDILCGGGYRRYSLGKKACCQYKPDIKLPVVYNTTKPDELTRQYNLILEGLMNNLAFDPEGFKHILKSLNENYKLF